MTPPLTTHGWPSKVGAALVPGFALALGVAGLIRVIAAPHGPPMSTVAQFAMWMTAPVWALVLSLCFLFRSGARAWGWLTAAAIVLWGVVILLKRMSA